MVISESMKMKSGFWNFQKKILCLVMKNKASLPNSSFGNFKEKNAALYRDYITDLMRREIRGINDEVNIEKSYNNILSA